MDLSTATCAVPRAAVGAARIVPPVAAAAYAISRSSALFSLLKISYPSPFSYFTSALPMSVCMTSVGTSVTTPFKPSAAALFKTSLMSLGVDLASFANLLIPIIIGAVSKAAAGSPPINARNPAFSGDIPSRNCSVYISPVS